MFSLISTSLSSSVSRFLTVELGRGNKENLKSVFSTSLSIQVALAAIVFVVAESFGTWFLNTHMTIPEERLYAANWVFQASIISFLFGLFSVPFNASIIAHEHMSAFAYIGILDVILKFAAVCFVAYAPCPFDKLIIYAILLLLIGIGLQLIYIIYCRRHFEECRLKFSFERNYWKEMSSFAGWNFIGCTAGLLKDQGVNLLFNIFFGPILNAARGLASTVNNVIAAFANNFMTALNPQLTKSYAAGDKEYCFSLVNRGSRFSFYIMMFFAIPLILETDFALNLWLEEFPEHTVNFVRLVLVLSMSDIISNTLIHLQLATGKIRDYQIVVGGILLLNFPLSYIALQLGASPEVTYIIAIAISLFCMIMRLVFLRKMAGISMKQFMTKVYFNILIVSIAAFIIPFLIHMSMDEGWTRFLVVGFTSVITSGLSICFIGCTHNERAFLFLKTKDVLHKIFKR